MKTDLTTRILLVGILVCLALLVVQGLGVEPDAAGRYRIGLASSRAGTVIVRMDSATGRVWRSEGFPNESRWVLIADPGDGDEAAAPPSR